MNQSCIDYYNKLYTGCGILMKFDSYYSSGPLDSPWAPMQLETSTPEADTINQPYYK